MRKIIKEITFCITLVTAAFTALKKYAEYYENKHKNK